MAIRKITYVDKVVNGGVSNEGKWLNENANEVKEVVNNNADELLTVVRDGDNITKLVNDAGYITLADIPDVDLSNYIQIGDNVSELVNDAGYITSSAFTSLPGFGLSWNSDTEKIDWGELIDLGGYPAHVVNIPEGEVFAIG